MLILVLNFCPLFIGISTVCLFYERTSGNFLYVNLLLDLDLFPKGGRYWAKKSGNLTSEKFLLSKRNFSGFLVFFREFRLNRHYFRQFDQNCFFCRKTIFPLTQVPSRCDESSHHFFNINVGEMTNWSILAYF